MHDLYLVYKFKFLFHYSATLSALIIMLLVIPMWAISLPSVLLMLFSLLLSSPLVLGNSYSSLRLDLNNISSGKPFQATLDTLSSNVHYKGFFSPPNWFYNHSYHSV
jgi:hypothetical protein